MKHIQMAQDMLKWTAFHRRSEVELITKRRFSDMHDIRRSLRPTQSSTTVNEKKSRRKSMNIITTRLEEHKENLQTNFLRRSLGTSESPLQDISNGQSPQRTTPRTPVQRATFRRQFACTLPTYEAEESPTIFQASPLKIRATYQTSFSSSQIGDVTLDRLIDAIIESAKKEFPDCDEAKSDDMDESIHEMEVKTPEGCHHLKRQRVVRRKTKHSERPRSRQTNGLTLPDGIPSPETPQAANKSTEKRLELANMETPDTMTFVVDSFPGISSKDMQSCSTPSPSRTNSIKRCLHFSPEDIEDSEGDGSLNDKRKSVASSTGSSSCSAGKDALIKGSIDLAIFVEKEKLNVHVIRCRDLQRPNGCSALNAYVKVALLPADVKQDNGFQRTAVHRNSSRPYFDHRFTFDISSATEREDKRIQLAVWHRDRELKRSEFLGCLSFPVKSVIRTAINGSYKLQSQSCLTNPQPPITGPGPYHPSHPIVAQSTPSKLITNNISTGETSSIATTNEMASSTMAQQQSSKQRSDSVEEDLISVDSASAAVSSPLPATGYETNSTGKTIILSKKAIHQRDADENLFLRFLELDPPPDGSGSGSQGRRMSTFKPAVGRTPFTITKKLTRTAEKGFGFSVVWTHPPRVEKIEPGNSAEKNGILPGDFIIFVDKHNVVTMPEADVLNLIRSQGTTLTLEIFRRTGSSNISAFSANNNRIINNNLTAGATTCPIVVNSNLNGFSGKKVSTSATSNYTAEEMSPAIKQTVGVDPRPSTVCSNASLETTKRRLHLPQVTFSKESIAPCHTVEDQRRRILVQVVTREQNYVNTLQFGMQRFAAPLQERRDLISPNDHRTLFQNIDELIRISEDILEQLVQDDQEIPLNFASRVYLSKTTAICAAYKKYCNGIKRADCVLVNKSRQPGSEFVSFITEPQVPRKRPDLTMFIHRPLQHFREILKLMQLLASHCRVDSEEHKNFTSVINELQAAYREITVGGGLMEPLGEGRPLLTLQDLESRMVFTRCKPFTLATQGRQWIFGGDLSRVEGRSVKPYWTLLFSDILVFTKVSRDRVMFITEEPLPIANIVDSCFNMRKKTTEFRLTVDPNGRTVESPTAYCAPDLSRTPKKNLRRKSLILRAPSLELKAVWQNLLQRQIFLVNAALGSTPLSSPLESPDIFHTLVPLSDIGATTTSMASIRLSSMDSVNLRNQQNRGISESQQIEQLIDEKCRILNKTGTPKGSALHLANWMKGQLDKQQEQARMVAAELKQMNGEEETNEQLQEVPEEDERITFWTREQLEKRTKELNLSKDMKPPKRYSGVEDVIITDSDEEEIKSPSRSTTSDSQITVRSSPIANATDKLSVCRHCHKNCKRRNSPTLLCNSLKVQHSQASPNRCCQLSSLASTLTSNDIASSDQSVDKSSKSKDENKHQTDAQSTTASSTIASPRILNAERAELSPAKSIPETTATATSTTTTNSTSTNPPNIKPPTTHNKFNPCHCKCSPEDFQNTTLSPDELHQETCRLLEDVSKIPTGSPAKEPSVETTEDSLDTSKDFDKNRNKEATVESGNELVKTVENPHKFCKCVCKNGWENSSKNQIDHNAFNESGRTSPRTADDDISLVLIGLAQLTPAAKLVNSDAFVPTISIVPSTPDAVLSKTSTCIWDNTSTTATATKVTTNHLPHQNTGDTIPEDSPDESPQDEEPPYKSLNASLKRYGTMSSLEKVASEDGDEEDADEQDEEDDVEEEEEEDNDLEVITREVFTNNANNASLRNWTARAGSFVAEKMSFFEESRAFIDKYLGRWNQEHGNREDHMGDEEQLEECTSGATSGEEVWGTPTSGGENDDMNMQNSDHTPSSPTRSSSSLTGDDDTELMMDELLMAPPMTASAIRGLLPRRRLEPLFEEESESEEERTQQEEESLVKKGETSANGYDLRESSGTLRGVTTTMSSLPNIPPSLMKANVSERMSSDMLIMNENLPPTVSITTTMTMKTTILPTTAVNSVVTSETPNMDNMSNNRLSSVPATTCHVVRKAKFSPPPPPPRRLLLTQSDLKNQPQNHQQRGTVGQGTQTGSSAGQSKINGGFGRTADKCSLVGAGQKPPSERKTVNGFTNVVSPSKVGVESRECGESTTSIEKASRQSESTKSSTENNRPETVETQTTATSSPSLTSASTTTSTTPSQSPSQKASGSVSGLSPRLEMRLALNHDIMGDEDLINYDPGPDLTTILGHDLSRFHRLTGRDLLTRSANRIQPKETVISYSQQRNSKMDTPTLNRKMQRQHQPHQQLQQHHQPNLNTWSSSAYVDRIDGNVMQIDSNNTNEMNNLSDLEILAKQEKMYCMSQLKSGSPARNSLQTRIQAVVNISSTESVIPISTSNQPNNVADTRASRFFNFLTRRNSEDVATRNSSNQSLNSSNASSIPDRKVFSPRKDNDKPSLNRRFWKQITKRRRSNSVSEITAS